MPTAAGRVREFIATWRQRNIELADQDELGKMEVLISRHRALLQADVYGRGILKRFDAEVQRRKPAPEAPAPGPIYASPEARRALYQQYMASGRATPGATGASIPRKPAPGGALSITQF